MAQLVVSAAAAAAGTLIGLPPGVGWALGAAAYASSQTVRNRGPISNDLKAPKLQYGSPIPRSYGRMRVAGSPVWISDKRPIANTTSEGGKGGPKVENTTYTYEVDALYIVKIEAPLALAVTRVWVGGELKFSALASSDEETLEASAATDAWEEMTLFNGSPSQMPWSVYEASVGTANALAYRHRTTIGITALQLGSSDQLPLVEFEIITAGSSEDVTVGLFLADFTSSSTADQANDPASFSSAGGAALGGTPPNVEFHFGDGGSASYSGAKFLPSGTTPYTFETLCRVAETGSAGTGARILAWEFFSNDEAGFSFDPISGLTYPYMIRGGVQEFGTPFAFSTGHLGISVKPTGIRWLALGSEVWSTSDNVYVGVVGNNRIRLGPGGNNIGSEVDYYFRAIRIVEEELYPGAYDPPATLSLGEGYTQWTPDVIDLADVVEAECVLAGLDASKVDVTDLAGIEVTGFAASGSARQVIEQLMAGYYFEACCSDKLYFRRRGRAVAATIVYEDLAAGVDQATDTTFDPVRGNLEELPAQVACGFMNLSADYEAGSEMGDRLVGPGKLVQKVDLPLVLTPAEGKGRALAMVMDALAAGTTATVSLTDDYAELEPTDAIVVPDRDDNTRRMRVVRETYAQGVKTLELVGDDPSALVTSGLTMDESTPAISVRPPSDTELTLLDMPILRDVDNTPGFMAAFYGPTGWPGARLFRSVDGLTFDGVVTATDKALTGSASTTLADYSGWRWDETNTVTVNVNGTLASSTRDAMQADQTINAMLIGDEVIRFRTATLVDVGIYTLSGLLRGLRGTEWARALHGPGERVVLLRPAGLRRIQHTASDISLERTYRAVTLGRQLGTAEDQAFTDTGIALKPFAPSRLRATRDGSDNVTLTVMRRTRLAVRHGGVGGTYAPIGEAEDLVEVDVYDDDTFTTVLRTVTGTSEGIEYTAAQQTADGLTPGDPVSVRAYQVSAVVGRGYALEGTV